MLDNSNHTKSNENFVLDTRDFIIKAALTKRTNVIIDDTNMNPKHEADIRALAKEFGATVEVKTFFDVPVEELIARDLLRPASVGETVIRKMYSDFVQSEESNKPEVVYIPPQDAPKAIIVDIDGTLAHNKSGRNIYDYSLAINDDKDDVIADMVDTYHRQGYTIIICSGREDSSREITERWFSKHNIAFNFLYMRKAGDHRKDSIIKKEIFDAYIRDKWNIKFVLDDRNQVVDMWRDELGLKVLQVAPGNF